jgi:hypothetical protein
MHLEGRALGAEGADEQGQKASDDVLCEVTHAPACPVCGHPVFDAKKHDIPAPRAAKMFPITTSKCVKPARVRCFNGVGTYWTECEDGHGRGRPA